MTGRLGGITGFCAETALFLFIDRMLAVLTSPAAFVFGEVFFVTQPLVVGALESG